MPTSRQNRATGSRKPKELGAPEPNAQAPKGPAPNGPDQNGDDGPGRLNEIAAGAVASLLMTQPVLWPSVAQFRNEDPDAFQKLASWPTKATRTARTGTKALRSFLFFSL